MDEKGDGAVSTAKRTQEKAPHLQGFFVGCTLASVSKGKGSADARLERALQLGVLPLEASLVQSLGNHDLAFQQKRRHVAHGQAERKSRHTRCPMGTVQSLGQGGREGGVVDRVRSDHIEGPFGLGVLCGPKGECHDVVDVNPACLARPNQEAHPVQSGRWAGVFPACRLLATRPTPGAWSPREMGGILQGQWPVPKPVPRLQENQNLPGWIRDKGLTCCRTSPRQKLGSTCLENWNPTGLDAAVVCLEPGCRGWLCGAQKSNAGLPKLQPNEPPRPHLPRPQEADVLGSHPMRMTWCPATSGCLVRGFGRLGRGTQDGRSTRDQRVQLRL